MVVLWINELKKNIRGDVLIDEKSLKKYSSDASIFEITPQAVVFPKDNKDVGSLIEFVNKKKQQISDISLTARAGGTDMAGGPLNNSIIVVFTKYFNHIISVGKNSAVIEPGVYYRDFEKRTLKKGLILPSYPASKSICTLGGMIANNAGGEKNTSIWKNRKVC